MPRSGIFSEPSFDVLQSPSVARADWNEHRAAKDILGCRVLVSSLSPAGLRVGSGPGRDGLRLSLRPTGNFASAPRSLRRLTHGSWAMNRKGVSVDSISPLELAVRSQDGPERKVRFESSHLSDLFEAFKAPEGFRQARVGSCRVAWPGQIDLAPDAIDREIRRTGERVLR